MELDSIRRVVPDEWIKVEETTLQYLLRRPPNPIGWILPPVRSKKLPLVSYVLGYRVAASEEEASLIRTLDMLLQPFIHLRKNEPPITFAEALGPDWNIEIQPSQNALLQTEFELKAACMTWTHFLESLGE